MKYFSTLFVILLLSACGSQPSRQESPVSIAPSNEESQMNNMAIYAMSLSDTRYKWGGTSRANGFDCSGFVQFVFQNSLGLQLPRTSAEMSRVGTPLAPTQLRPGDLVFFNTTRTPNSHVGIFIGENRFVHSPKTGKAISIASLNDKYWNARFNGARRIALNQ
jgi:cell wall-associated NlpC family hydrolase